MNLNRAKQLVKKEMGINHVFLYRGARNQLEEFDGIITKCFSSVFIVVSSDDKVRSFSYNDFIVKNFKIIS